MWSPLPSALALPILLAACAGSSVDTEPDTAGLGAGDFRPDLVRSATPVQAEILTPDQLPEANRAVLDAWRTGGFTWEIKRGEVLSDPELTSFLVDNLLLVVFQEHQAIRGFGRADGAAGEGLAASRAAYARARGELPLLGEPAAVALAETLSLGDDTLFALVKDILGEMGPDGAPAVAGLLERESALVRHRAASVLARLPRAGMREQEVTAALARCAAEDKVELVRVQATRSVAERGLWAAAGRNLKEVDLGPTRRTLEACLVDEAEAVRLEALLGLRLLGDAAALPALIDYGRAARRDERFKELSAAGAAVRELTGRDLGVDPGAWGSWWREHGAVEGQG